MPDIVIQFDEAQIARMVTEVGGMSKRFLPALRSAINRVGRGVRADVVKAIGGKLNITQADLRRRNVFFHGAVASQGAMPYAEVNVRGHAIPIGRFKPRPATPNPQYQRRVAGTSVEVYRGRRQVFPRAFTAMVGKGHVAPFLRKGAKRLPIYEPRGPSVPRVAEGMPGLAAESLGARISADLERFFLSAMRYGRFGDGGAGNA